MPCLFSFKATVDQIGQALDGGGLVGSVCDQRNGRALNDSERENTEQALRIDTAVLLFHPDRALVGIGLLNEKCSRSCMKADAVTDGNALRDHINCSLVYSFLICFLKYSKFNRKNQGFF